MGIKYSDPFSKSKFHSKYLNSETTFVGQIPLNGTGTIAIKDKSLKKRKKNKKRKSAVNLIVWVSLQDRMRLVISLQIE